MEKLKPLLQIIHNQELTISELRALEDYIMNQRLAQQRLDSHKLQELIKEVQADAV